MHIYVDASADELITSSVLPFCMFLDTNGGYTSFVDMEDIVDSHSTGEETKL